MALPSHNTATAEAAGLRLADVCYTAATRRAEHDHRVGLAFSTRAELVEALDLVVTSDTSVAHLAGALGVPVWVVLQKVPDWRWLLETADCPWYPTMRLFRQRVAGDWSEVFERLADNVAALISTGRPQAPQSDRPTDR